MPSPETEMLDPPTKAPTDHKDYRAIRLSNGLRAILVSDPGAALAAAAGVAPDGDTMTVATLPQQQEEVEVQPSRIRHSQPVL